MSNNLLTISKITNEALMVLENELTFTSEVDRNYDDQFAVVGAKIGNTVNVRKMYRCADEKVSLIDLESQKWVTRGKRKQPERLSEKPRKGCDSLN